MSNEFSLEVRALNIFEPYCEKCGSNNNCSFHHIFGRISNSALNCILLCEKCHKEADGFNRITGMKGTPHRQELLEIRLKNLTKWEYEYTKKDKEFMQTIHTDLVEVLER